MKIPDKIYIEIRHPFRNEFTEIVGFENRGNSEDIEYIRKDAFMELINYELFRRQNTGNDYFYPAIVVLNDLLDKLNSM